MRWLQACAAHPGRRCMESARLNAWARSRGRLRSSRGCAPALFGERRTGSDKIDSPSSTS
eukprot:55262-Pyramimonas_sp.AAC.1